MALRWNALIAAALVVITRTGQAQGVGSGDAGLLIAPSYAGWRFGDAVPTDSIRVARVSQLALPFAAAATLGRVSVDLSGTWTRGSVSLENGRSLTLSGPTDFRVRGVYRFAGDRLQLTTGVNLPVGPTGLAGDELDALSVLGSPALGFPALPLGNGFGVTGGAVYAFRAGGWGLALGSSYETRSRYTPVEARIAGVTAPAEFTPGGTLRFSLGADRLIGRGRASLMLGAELYGQSQVDLRRPDGAPLTSKYTMGPQLSGSLLVDLAPSGFRFFRVLVSDRYRSAFTTADGSKAGGSSGNVLGTELEFVTGGPRGAGLYVRANGRLDSGLEVDNTITTAAMTEGGLTIGVASHGARTTVLPWIRAQAGRLDTGTSSTTALGYGAGISVTVRR
jgi:hypothetical protein